MRNWSLGTGMLSRASVLGVTILMAALSSLSVGSAASAGAEGRAAEQGSTGIAAETKEACRNLGNGNLCIRVVASGNTGKVTVWYDKNAGTPVHIRLRYISPGGPHWDNGHFWISTGQVRGFIWYNQPMFIGCFTAQMQDITNGALGLINGGYVCY